MKRIKVTKINLSKTDIEKAIVEYLKKKGTDVYNRPIFNGDISGATVYVNKQVSIDTKD